MFCMQIFRSRPIFYALDRASAESSNWSFIMHLVDAGVSMTGEDKMFSSGLSAELQALLLLSKSLQH